MPVFPQLKHPPIVEAQLNFLADASSGWKVYGTAGRIVEIFPTHTTVQPLQQFVFRQNAGQAEISAGMHGFFLRNPSEPTVFQVRRDGFAFSRLPPYSGWENFVQPGLAAWEHFRGLMDPGTLHGLGLRYINRLEIPREEFIADRDKFLTIAPRVPISEHLPGKPWGFINFAHQSLFLTPDERFQVAVSLARELPDLNAAVTVILLDINVTPQPGVLGGTGMDGLLAEMRDLKNQAFFSITTDESRRPYS